MVHSFFMLLSSQPVHSSILKLSTSNGSLFNLGTLFRQGSFSADDTLFPRDSFIWHVTIFTNDSLVVSGTLHRVGSFNDADTIGRDDSLSIYVTIYSVVHSSNMLLSGYMIHSY